MRLELTSEKDNFNLCEFFAGFGQSGLIDVKYLRHPDFFGPFKTLSDEYKTFCLRDNNDEIRATASFVFRKALIDGKVKKIATATDLRVGHDRDVIIQWSKHFLPVMKSVMNEHKVDFIFSSINLSDPLFMSTFVRPRTAKRPMPRYFLYRKFNLVSIHGRYPLANKKLASIKVEHATDATLGELAQYVKKRSQYRPFASVWDEESLRQKISRLPGMNIEDMLIARSSRGEILGCLGYWNPLNVQSIVPLSYSLRAHNFRQILKFLWMFGYTRRLTKPVASTGVERPLEFKYVLNLHSDNEDVFESLLFEAFNSISKREFLLYAHCEHDYRLLPPLGWVSASIPYAMYTVVGPDQEMPDFLNPSIAVNPEVESLWI
jgi:hypothetical protein